MDIKRIKELLTELNGYFDDEKKFSETGESRVHENAEYDENDSGNGGAEHSDAMEDIAPDVPGDNPKNLSVGKRKDPFASAASQVKDYAKGMSDAKKKAMALLAQKKLRST